MDRKIHSRRSLPEVPEYVDPVENKYSLPVLGLPFYVVIALLVVASFMLGSLYTKVQYLEKGSDAAVKPSAVAGDSVVPPARPTIGDVPKLSDKEPIRGNRNADVVLITYTDFECPFCKNFHTTMQSVMESYQDKIKWVYRDYPLGFHANAQKEAEAAKCAADLGGVDGYWKYVDGIFERTTSNGTGFALDNLVPLAKEINLNEAKFKECLDSNKFAKAVKDEMTAGQNAGVQGTPATVVLNLKNGKKETISGALPLDQVKAAIDNVL
jgi:protein-disulfide isomerase